MKSAAAATRVSATRRPSRSSTPRGKSARPSEPASPGILGTLKRGLGLLARGLGLGKKP